MGNLLQPFHACSLVNVLLKSVKTSQSRYLTSGVIMVTQLNLSTQSDQHLVPVSED